MANDATQVTPPPIHASLWVIYPPARPPFLHQDPTSAIVPGRWQCDRPKAQSPNKKTPNAARAPADGPRAARTDTRIRGSSGIRSLLSVNQASVTSLWFNGLHPVRLTCERDNGICDNRFESLKAL